MDKVNLPAFYNLGAALARLEKVDMDMQGTMDAHYASGELEDAITTFLDGYSGLRYCSGAANDLLEKLGEVQRQAIQPVKDDDPEVDLDREMKFIGILVDQAVRQARDFERLLIEELLAEPVYRVTKIGLFDIGELISQAENDLPQSTKEKLRPEVVTEIRESGRCLAFEAPTAAGFHILRALELVMLDYYIVVCKPSPRPARIESWGHCIQELRKVSDPALPSPSDPAVAKAVALLQQIKDEDRNLVMHPEKVLTTDEAFGLFRLSQAGMITLAEKLPVV